jgi:anti-anti-sigma regulatory factor
VITQPESGVGIARDEQSAVVLAGDYLNKFSGEQIERECKRRLDEGCTRLVVDFSQTDLVNSIGVSILLGVIDSAANSGAKVVFSKVKQDTVELFEMLGLTNHVTLA